MKAQFPECKRCCFCLPLRYGLLTWGYFKIVANALLIPIILYYLVITILLMMYFGIENVIHGYTIEIHLTLAITTLITLVMDFLATILFIVAGHKKNVKLLRVFYFYSIAMFIVSVVLAIWSVCLLSLDWISSEMTLGSWYTMLIICSAYFVVMVLQTYFLLLLRSEIMKLRNNNVEFRFVNNATEAECTMKCDEIVTGEETVKENV